MNYFYHWSYQESDDSFFAYVDDGTRGGAIVLQIENTDEVCRLIKYGHMNHIDDTDGLEDYLKEKGLIQEEDSLLIKEEMVL